LGIQQNPPVQDVSDICKFFLAHALADHAGCADNWPCSNAGRHGPDCVVWIGCSGRLCQLWPGWTDALIVVKPEILVFMASRRVPAALASSVPVSFFYFM
jgi:hypothetical protein